MNEISYMRERIPYSFTALEIESIERSSFSLPLSEKVLEEMMAEEKEGIYEFRTVRYEGVLVSYMITLDIFPEVEILRIGTEILNRRKGFADILIKSLKEEKKAGNYDKIYLEVRQSNDKAIALYEKNGFKKCGIRKGYYKIPAEDAVLMERILKHS